MSEHTFIESTKDLSGSIYLRYVLPKEAPKSVVLFAHGANIGSLCFDVPSYEKQTWLEYMASRGMAAFALDYRGYGQSSRPKAMDMPPEKNPPLITNEDATQDVLDVLDYISKLYPNLPINYVGFSWGTTMGGIITERFPTLINKMVMIGSVSSFPNQRWEMVLNREDVGYIHKEIGAYRLLSAHDVGDLWNVETPGPNKNIWRDPEIFNQIVSETIVADSVWALKNEKEGYMRAPCGILLDVAHIYYNRPLYNAFRVKAPCLILRGDHDIACHADDAQQLLLRLGSAEKSLITFGNATHYGFMERNCLRYWKATADFIEN